MKRRRSDAGATTPYTCMRPPKGATLQLRCAKMHNAPALPARTVPIVSDWSDLRYFLEAPRPRSHTAAARRLGVKHTNVARRLQRLGARALTPRLPPLLSRYPELHIELLLLPRSPSLAAREADLTVTLEAPRSGRYYVTRLSQLRYDLYGSAGYLAQHRPIKQRSDLAGHRFVDYVQTIC